jgi:AcrR family transcriptional regulator
MNDNGTDVKRRYRQTERAARAVATRTRIRTAATALFLERGYVATTMRQIAANAGVGERTLYDAFPTKAAVYEHVVGVAISGDEQPIPIAERPAFLDALAENHVGAAIAAFADYATEVLERSGPLIMVAVESSGADQAMRAFADRGAAATRDNAASFVQHLADSNTISADASDTVFALASPHVHQILREHSHLTADDYRDWLTRTIGAAIVADES